jgi:hypothetical protein
MTDFCVAVHVGRLKAEVGRDGGVAVGAPEGRGVGGALKEDGGELKEVDGECVRGWPAQWFVELGWLVLGAGLALGAGLRPD